MQAGLLAAASISASRRVSGPVTAGFKTTLLLVPAQFVDRCTEEDLLAAFAHECAHIKRRDFQRNVLYEVASLLIAFHPVTWLLKAQITQTREMICDAMASDELIDSQSYSQSLLRLAQMIAHRSYLSTTHAIGIFDANILEKRIMQMKAKKQTVSAAVKYGFTVMGALFLSVVTVCAAETAVAIQPQSQTQVYRAGGDVSTPKVISFKDPVYPESKRKGKGTFSGTCVLKLVVDPSGMPKDIQVVRSLGPDFDANAMDAVRQYRFTPGMKKGIAVPVKLNIEANFKKY